MPSSTTCTLCSKPITAEHNLCPKCLSLQKTKPLQENIDFYFENGLMVFTHEYHLKRGYCCKSGCRHCPYSFNF